MTGGGEERDRDGETRGGGGESAIRRGRGALGAARRWLLLDGNRLVVAGCALAVVTATVAVAERAGWVPLANVPPVYYVFSGFVTGNLTLITVVVSINQLLLSREFKSPGELEGQIENVVEYREAVEDHAGEVAPVEPLGFLELLFENTRREARRIGDAAFGTVGEEVREEIDDVVAELLADVDEVMALLDASDAGTFEVLSATLETNYAREINRIQRVTATHGDDLPTSVADPLDRLVTHLRNVDVARQYFKSLFLQQELSSLSRVLLYAGLPAETYSVLVLLGLTAGTESGLLGPTPLVVIVGVAVGFLPLCLLFSYILRVATVTRRTVATIPFTTPEQEQ